ncbi:MAG TPA: DUF1992 domain-containing protein [Abditibacterium sp.]
MPFRRVPDKPQRRGVVEEQIDEAIARGEFENLRGKGKPLDLGGDLADRDAMRTKIRHDAGFRAPWEDVAREIEVATDRARGAARRAWEFRLAGLRSSRANPAKIEADFEAARRDVQTQVAAVNSLILKYNLVIPPQLPRLHRPRLQESQIWESIAPEWWAAQAPR